MGVPTVLVTGCAGYIGSTLIASLLKARCKVIGIDNLMYDNGSAILSYLPHENFEFHRVDVRDYRQWEWLAERCDVAIPLAALVGAPICDKLPCEAAYVNEAAVVHLTKFLSPNQRILYPNTNSGYGQTDGSQRITEEDPLNPISVYGVTKCNAEKAVLDHKNSISLRLATVFGASPRMRLDLMVNDFACKLWVHQKCESQILSFVPRQGSVLTIFEPHYQRNFVGVRDVARAFVHLVLRPEYTGAYNLGLPSANMTKLELAHFVCDTLRISRDAVSIGEGKDPDQRNYLISNDKVLGTGFAFEHMLHEGVIEVANVVNIHTPDQLARMRNA